MYIALKCAEPTSLVTSDTVLNKIKKWSKSVKNSQEFSDFMQGH